MCINSRLIYNSYIRKSFRVDCGKCPACLQKKAMRRSTRIKDANRLGFIALFVTLTYRNDFVPFVYKKDIESHQNTLSVYRQSNIRKVRLSKNYRIGYKFFRDSYDVLSDIYVDYPDNMYDKPLKSLTGCNDRVGVLYFPDVQNFIKRLRINLKRRYNYEEKLSIFVCSEYGAKTSRPHFHLLIFIPRYSEQVVRNAIYKSWPFDDYYRKKKCVEVARDAASYVSSYVNSSSNISSFFENRSIRPKHSYSQHFGFGLRQFQLSTILENLDRGIITYDRQIKRDGVISSITLPLPKYVISRYFPKFKGFTRLPVYSLAEYIRNPSRLIEFRKELEYTDDDIYLIIVRLRHCYEYFHDITGLGLFEFSIYYVEIWKLYDAYIIAHQYDQVCDVGEFGYFYDNINEYLLGVVHSSSLDELHLINFIINPNELPYRVSQDYMYSKLFLQYDKSKKVRNTIMSQMDLNV